ncbi:tRNA/rRNA methyltransferase [Enterobacteriaceae bacterium ESL0689]|nr:tRNA/rRNA methyltransferase [Enterobacteriaceae bacterium ESL0689]
MHISIVLVAPIRAENVGAVARAMKTMGFNDLRIVSSDAHQQPAARWVAHGATDILDNARSYSTLAQALQDVSFTVATTARNRGRFHYYATPQQLLPLLAEKASWLSHVALVFGREDCGLTNDELALADILTSVPMVASYPSLNLGQSVMIYCYQLAALLQQTTTEVDCVDERQLEVFRSQVHDLLVRLDVAADNKLADWLQQRIGFLQQRDIAMLYRLLHDIEKNIAE